MTLFVQYKWRLLFTLLLILLEGGIHILFPLFIGMAIDGAIDNQFYGAINLGLLGIYLLFVGVSRRVFDSRFYAKVYQNIGIRIMLELKNEKASVKTARLNMIKELVEFFENSLPELINNVIGLLGVVTILYTLNIKVFLGSLVVTGFIFLLYWLTSKKTWQYNEKANNEWERQVDIISKKDEIELDHHLKEVNRWNIKLSDLEALNFSFSWLLALTFLIISIVISIDDGITKYGVLFALVMYVFQYIENVINLPLFYQNWLRLKEIIHRLEQQVKLF